MTKKEDGLTQTITWRDNVKSEVNSVKSIGLKQTKKTLIKMGKQLEE